MDQDNLKTKKPKKNMNAADRSLDTLIKREKNTVAQLLRKKKIMKNHGLDGSKSLSSQAVPNSSKPNSIIQKRKSVGEKEVKSEAIIVNESKENQEQKSVPGSVDSIIESVVKGSVQKSQQQQQQQQSTPVQKSSQQHVNGGTVEITPILISSNSSDGSEGHGGFGTWPRWDTYEH